MRSALASVESLSVKHYRNLAHVEVAFGPRLNVFQGDNGAGKTNLLEAIAYLVRLESFRGAHGEQLVEEGHAMALLGGRVHGRGLVRECAISLYRGAPRELLLDQKRVRALNLWRKVGAVVLFQPADVTLAVGDPEKRRQYLDRCLVQMDDHYREALRTYEKALRSRNRLLRQRAGDMRSWRAYNEILAASGVVIGRSREQLVGQLRDPVCSAVAEILGEDVQIALEYRARSEPTVQAILEAFEQTEEKDRVLGYTTRGPHTDDVAILMKGDCPAKHRSSQGQQRVMALGLRLAEMHVIARSLDFVPILLLDDVSSELDRDRTTRFFALLAHEGGQIFLTTTQPQLITIEQERTTFAVVRGQVRDPGQR